MRILLTLVLACLLCTCVPAQDQIVPGFLELDQARIDHQRQAMLVLGGWAAGNIGLGLALRNRSGKAGRFHEMNAIWNVVNLGIAGFGYYSALREPAAVDAFGALAADVGFQKILLFNAGLDVGYILGGFYLIERGRREGVDRDQLRGYGRAVILQGGFLFVFDLINYLIANERTEQYRAVLAPATEGLGFSLQF